MALSQLEVTGAETYAVTLANKYIENGNKVFILSDTLTKKTTAEYIKFPFTKRKLIDRIINVSNLVRIIKENNIEIVHANSRASGWISYFACKFAKIPLITTVHGLQPIHASRKFLPAFGERIIAVCENIQTHLIEGHGIESWKTKVIRNGINISDFRDIVPPNCSEKKTLSIIGRLSGPKGKIAIELINQVLTPLQNITINLIGGCKLNPKIKMDLNKNINYVGYVENVEEWISKSNLVIGAGRVAMESIAMNVPTIAIGESKSVGLVTAETLNDAIKSNFGDIDLSINHNFDKISKDINYVLEHNYKNDFAIKRTIEKEYDININQAKIYCEYEKAYCVKRKYFVPVLCYHRIAKDGEITGRHGIYVRESQFEKHMSYLKNKGYKSIDIDEMIQIPITELTKGKYVVITFDDGYRDNYEIAFPIMLKYGMKGTIYQVTGLRSNKWDSSNGEIELNLMVPAEIREMSKYGFSFGAHTENHKKLISLSNIELSYELLKSKKKLEDIISKEINSICYPYGLVNNIVKKECKELGLKYGIATDSGPSYFKEDLMHIRRIIMFPNTTLQRFARRVNGTFLFNKRIIMTE